MGSDGVWSEEPNVFARFGLFRDWTGAVGELFL